MWVLLLLSWYVHYLAVWSSLLWGRQFNNPEVDFYSAFWFRLWSISWYMYWKEQTVWNEVLSLLGLGYPMRTILVFCDGLQIVMYPTFLQDCISHPTSIAGLQYNISQMDRDEVVKRYAQVAMIYHITIINQKTSKMSIIEPWHSNS